jgi:hypothetical protein
VARSDAWTRSLLAGVLVCVSFSITLAQSPADPELEACRATGLAALRERSPAVKDVIFDYETFSVSKANTKVEDTPVRTVIMGEVYLERKETGGAQKFLCLVGEKGKVLLTFFTTR